MIALAALASLALAAPQESKLLPETPADWRFERLDFPLSFAPDLEFEGFEELRFAPGMFDPDSDSYFSYVLAIRLEEEIDVDGEFLESFFDAYYRGLCRAVGEGQGLSLDLSKVSTRVERGARGFLATIDMFDPFVTGEAMRLHLELDVHPGSRTTELFGLASPLAKDTAIWEELRGIGERWRAARPVAVLLNHLYVVPDQETYDALCRSEFLRESLAVSEERETVRRDTSYSGLYFYGDNTYFEFLPPSEQRPAGSTGVAFGVEVQGGTAALEQRLGEREVTTFVGPVTREADGEQVPWFQILGVQAAHASSRLSLFSLEYDPRFLASWYPDLPPESLGIARRGVLERYAAKLGQEELRGRALLADVVEIHLALDEEERARLLQVCRAFGWVVAEESGAWTCDGPRIDLVVSPSDSPGGVTGFAMSLRRPVEREPIELGRVRITFQDRFATLTFRP